MRARFPAFVDPELAVLVERAPVGEGWLHEIKIDGYRAGAMVERGKVRMYSRNANDWTARFRSLPGSLAELPAKSMYLDGEVAVLTDKGISNFEELQSALGRSGTGDLVYIVFDILMKDGRDLRALP